MSDKNNLSGLERLGLRAIGLYVVFVVGMAILTFAAFNGGLIGLALLFAIVYVVWKVRKGQ